MRSRTYIILLTILISCSSDNKDKLIGEWYLLDEWVNTGFDIEPIDTSLDVIIPTTKPDKGPWYTPTGFEFFYGDTVEYLDGIWELKQKKKTYIGQYRRYKIKSDSLLIYDKNKKIKDSYKFVFQSKDTLNLLSAKKTLTLIRFNSKNDLDIKIDSIKITSGNGWGKNIEYIVTSDLKIYYKNNSIGFDNADYSIYNEGSISQFVFDQIVTKYKKSNFLAIESYNDCCDHDNYITDIYYNGNKTKQIVDYDGEGQMQIIWANRYLMAIILSKLEIEWKYKN